MEVAQTDRPTDRAAPAAVPSGAEGNAPSRDPGEGLTASELRSRLLPPDPTVPSSPEPPRVPVPPRPQPRRGSGRFPLSPGNWRGWPGGDSPPPPLSAPCGPALPGCWRSGGTGSCREGSGAGPGGAGQTRGRAAALLHPRLAAVGRGCR